MSRKIPAVKITPSSIIGSYITVFSRNIHLPFTKIYIDDERCDHLNYFYSGSITDNSSAKVEEETTENCMKTKFTLSKIDSKISGLQIDIKTKVKVRSSNISVKNKTGRHKAQFINLNKMTYAELIKEECNIINSKDYHILLDKKNKNDFTDGYITID